MTVEIRTESDEVVSSSTNNSATMGLSIQRSNGLYHCLTEESQTQYFSFFFRNSGISLYMYPFSHACTEIYETQSFTENALSHRRLALYILLDYNHDVLHPAVTLQTPAVGILDTTLWTLTSPDGSRVERYIVEFECRVQNLTFVEKYMSVSASGGTGRVATNVSCFGGLGQLYRVKVWAVSGPNISRALVCVTDGQCIEEGMSFI